MSDQTQSEARVQADWEKQVEAEAMKFVEAVEHNFMHGLNMSLSYLPDPKNPEQRGTQLDYFINATIGATIRNIVKTANSSKEFEDYVVEEVRRKFAYVREYQEKMARESKIEKPLGLVGLDGKPMSHG